MHFLNVNSRLAVVFYFISFFGGAYLILIVGDRTLANAKDYELGNRRRVISVYRILWITAHLSLIIYWHLFSLFKSREVKYTNFSALKDNPRLKQIALIIFWFVVIETHLCYYFYIMSYPVSWLVFEVASICTGIWMHLVFFSVLFLGINFTVDCLKMSYIRQNILNLFDQCNWLKRLMSDTTLQVSVTLYTTLVLCLVQYFMHSKIFVKEATFALSKWPVDHSEMRIAILTDIHTGGSVHTNHVEKVVEITNSLDVDAIFLIGDTVDAPRSWIESRTKALKKLKSKLGTYLVTGNHEYYYGNWYEWLDLFLDYKINVLENRAVSVGPMCVVGLNDISSGKSGLPKHFMDTNVIGNCSQQQPIVVLSHNPAAVSQILSKANQLNKHVDLIFSGHTHAAQVIVMVPFAYWYLPYFYGIYSLDSGTTQLLVSSGTLWQATPMKIPFLSEVWIVTLKSDKL